MAREWRETGGKSGLPVIEVGHQLRVPRRALDELINGGKLRAGGPQRSAQATNGQTAGATEDPPVTVERRTRQPRRSSKTPTRRRNNAKPNQLKLFDSTD
jgi:hypothetical protein